MAKVIKPLCDKHLIDGEEVVGDVEETITIDGAEYVLDLCKDHYVEWFQPFVDEIKDFAVQASASKSSAITDEGKYACPVGRCGRSYRHKSSMRQHVRDDHPDVAIEPRSEPVPCEFCSKEVHGSVGLVQHVRQAHPNEYEVWRASNTKAYAQSSLSVNA